MMYSVELSQSERFLLHLELEKSWIENVHSFIQLLLNCTSIRQSYCARMQIINLQTSLKDHERVIWIATAVVVMREDDIIHARGRTQQQC